MHKSFKHAVLRLGLLVLTIPMMAALHAAGPDGSTPRPSASSGGQMRVGITIVAPNAAPLPTPAELAHPASPTAVLCRSEGAGYRECRLPFRGRVMLSREVADTRCIEGGNWGWRDGAVWVDRGCAAVFVREAATSPAA